MNKIENSTTPLMSPKELALLGDGEVAYIKQVDTDAAERLFPSLEGAPEGIDLFAVLGADGTPIAEIVPARHEPAQADHAMLG